MPAYNASRYIEEAIQSVLDQTWANWELIVVNDGSTDGTLDFLITLTDRRIRIVNQANRGVSAARNAGLELATGEFIAFLDADDVLPQNSLTSRLLVMKTNPDIDVVGGIVKIYDEFLNQVLATLCPTYCGPFLDKLLVLDKEVFSSITYLARGGKIKDIKFRTELANWEDLLFWIEAAKKADLQYSAVKEEVYSYRTSVNSASGNLTGWERGIFTFSDLLGTINGLSYRETFRLRVKLAAMILKYFIRRNRFTEIPGVARLFAWTSPRLFNS